MKSIENKIAIGLLSLSLLGFISSCLTQKEKLEQTAILKNIISQKDFKFVATSAQPQRNNYFFPFSNYNLVLNPMITQNLNSYYSLSIKNDSLNCHLPYFGVVNQSIAYNSADQGIKFTSSDFSYEQKQNSNGNYSITIVPNEKQRANKLYLNVSADGSASLNINFNDRDGILFYGNIQAIEKN
jgi:hypothetical protein